MRKLRTLLAVAVGAACVNVALLAGPASAQAAEGDLPWTKGAGLSVELPVIGEVSLDLQVDLPWT